MILRPLKQALLAVALVAMAGCSERSPETYRQEVYVFGTLVDITIYDAPRDRARDAMNTIADVFRRMHHDWHAWEPGPLTKINDAIAAGRPAHVIPSLLPVIRKSKALSLRSGGLFNPAIGGLLNLWGFQSNEPPDGPPPSEQDIARWVQQDPSMDDIRIEGDRLISSNSAVQLDFGAFAKGYALDRATRILKESGIENAIVNAGGDLRAIGRHGDRPWQIGIRHPQGGGVLGALEIAGDKSVFTSGNYERYREHEGVRYMHILDPRTGMPVEGVTSVTVIHHDGAVADAAATALVVAGPDEWYPLAQKLGVQAVMLVDEAGTVYMDPAMARLVDFRGNPPERIVTSRPLRRH